MKVKYINAVDSRGERLDFAVEGGRIVNPGGVATAVDLEGKTVLPGFVDAHCHIIPMGLDLLKLNLSHCATREDVLDAVRDWSLRGGDGWLLAVQYDQTKFSDSRHLTRFEIDSVVSDRPVLLRHSNGHASIANSSALEMARIDVGVPDPTGGTYVRNESGELTGVLLERAHEHVSNCAPQPSLSEMTEAVLRASEKMAALGITCASDMMTGRWNLERELLAYHAASQQGAKVRLRLYAQWGTMLGPRRLEAEKLREICDAMDPNLCRLAGVKIFADGAIGSATAAIHGTYLTTGGNGQMIYPPDKLTDMIRAVDQGGWQLAVHTIGDRSTDFVMDALELCSEPSRHRVEHAMILSDEQIQRLVRLNPFVTMQPEFLIRFGHSYLKQLGPEVASKIKRCRSVIDAGIRLSFSSDRPIVPGDPWDGIAPAVNRQAGFDPSENVSLHEAIDLYTRESAKVNGDACLMGEIKPGRLADFQIYDRLEKGSLRSVFMGGSQTH